MCALTLGTHYQVSFKKDLQLVNVRRWQNVIVKSDNTPYDRVVVQQEGLLRRDGWQLNLTICWKKSAGLSYLDARLTDRAVRVRVVHRFIW